MHLQAFRVVGLFDPSVRNSPSEPGGRPSGRFTGRGKISRHDPGMSRPSCSSSRFFNDPKSRSEAPSRSGHTVGGRPARKRQPLARPIGTPRAVTSGMKIAQIVPGRGDAPPRRHVATQSLAFDLAGALQRRGHDSTVFVAPEGSASIPEAAVQTFLARHRFDLVHVHLDDPCFDLRLPADASTVVTVRGSVDHYDFSAVAASLRHTPCVAISNIQRCQRPWLNWRDTIPDGLPPDRYSFQAEPSDYLAFVGPVTRASRLDRAVEIASQSGLPLRVLPVDDVDPRYVERLLMRADEIDWVETDPSINPDKKVELLANARALVVPGNLPEPPDSTILEAMACGTPTIAFSGASGVELVSPGVTGFIVDSVLDAVEVIDDVNVLNRNLCRSRFLRHFTIERVAEDYLAVYRDVLATRSPHPLTARTGRRRTGERPALQWPI